MASEVPDFTRLPPLHLLRSDCFLIGGNVTVHPSATIAPGVLLQADPGSEITIAAGVCIGAGSILHAHQGMLEVEAHATLGAGVLVVGSGKIGQNACVGSKTLVCNSSIEPHQVIPAGSMIGDVGRQAVASAAPVEAIDPASPLVENPPRGATVPIYGKAALDRLLTAMLPHRQSLNGLPTPEDHQPQ